MPMCLTWETNGNFASFKFFFPAGLESKCTKTPAELYIWFCGVLMDYAYSAIEYIIQNHKVTLLNTLRSSFEYRCENNSQLTDFNPFDVTVEYTVNQRYCSVCIESHELRIALELESLRAKPVLPVLPKEILMLVQKYANTSYDDAARKFASLNNYKPVIEYNPNWMMFVCNPIV